MSATAASTIMNVAKAALGPGLFALPWAFMYLGAAGGALAAVSAGIFAWAAAVVIAGCCEMVWEIRNLSYTIQEADDEVADDDESALVSKPVPTSLSFKDILQASYGPKAGYIVEAAVVCTTSSMLVAMAVLFPDYLQTVTEHWASGSFITKRWACLVFPFIPCYCLCQLTKLHNLRYTSMMGQAAILYSVIAIMVKSISHASTRSAFGDSSIDEGEDSYSHLFSVFPIFLFSVGFHTNAPTYYMELKDRSLSKFGVVIGAALTIVVTFNTACGLTGYLQFGGETKSNILLNYSATDTSLLIGRLLLVIACVFSYPFPHFASRKGLYQILGVTDPTWKMNLIESACVVPTTFLIAYFTHSLGDVVSFTGGFVATLVYMILPSTYIILLKKLKAQESADPVVVRSCTRWSPLAYILPCWGLFCVSSSIFSTFYRITH
eukprot:TRINITY_DN15082_c3_g1_i1.p1 TRINITY_DN15082_c3_g1~~TRINITY_DN15082_c3_g1_i1.p1  ORF type:complete len:461 (+),score=62.40 TRINITY_DN15082_c3_g1_i1:77-1384(+)